MLSAQSSLNHTAFYASRVQNAPIEYATKAANIYVVAIFDGPCEGTVFDSTLAVARQELSSMMPPLAAQRNTPPSGTQDRTSPQTGLQVQTWVLDENGSPVGIITLCVFVLFTGIMADSPMRNKIYKNLQWNGLMACDFCTLAGVKLGYKVTKFFGCAAFHEQNHCHLNHQPPFQLKLHA